MTGDVPGRGPHSPEEEKRSSLDRAIEAVDAGMAVVYPTETVYGLGADATNKEAVAGVFALKRRPRDKPLSVAVHSVAAIHEVANPSVRTRRFLDEFLPGPVTVVCERRDDLPSILTAGGDRVGVRIPSSDRAIELLERTPPLTATSANVTGGPDVCHPDELDDRIRAGVGAVLEAGQTPGGPSTVVDVDRGIIHRRGQAAPTIERWLEDVADQADSP